MKSIGVANIRNPFGLCEPEGERDNSEAPFPHAVDDL